MAFQQLKDQRGIALIQVIITTTIILLLTIFFLTLAKSQVNRAQSLQDKSTAYLNHYTAKNRLLFGLLTNNVEQLRKKGWNFHGQPFEIMPGTSVQLQDLAGLFSLTSMTQGTFLQKLLEEYIDKGEARTIAASVMDWVDSDNSSRSNGAEQADYAGVTVRNGPIQTFTELAYVKGMTIEAEQVLMENATFQPTAYFNPMTAPERLLAAYVGDKGKAAAVTALKKQKNFNSRAVEDLTQVTHDEGVDYIIGPGFRLTFDSRIGEAYFGKVMEVQILPYRQYPVVLLNQTPKRQDY